MLREIIRALISSTLHPFERFLVAQNSHNKNIPAPCFIIGAPRSGTTLIYETLTVRFNFSYFSNLSERLYKTPAASSYLSRDLMIKRKSGVFSTKYGVIQGWGAPSEGGRIWNRWIAQSHYLPANFANNLPTETIRAIISSISNSVGGPFLNKNVMHSVHIELLDRIFPNCIFIEVQRQPISNIRSIIRARKKRAGPREADNWWSVKPTTWESYQDASLEEQASVQVCSLRSDISNQMGKISPKRRKIIHYEQFCEQPAEVMDNIKTWFREQHNIRLLDKGEIPQKFSVSASPELSPQIEDNIANLVNKFCSNK